ncbi:MAG: DUF6946 family protein [Terriglobales bacterium]
MNKPPTAPDASQKFFVLAKGKTIPVVRPEDIIPYLVAQEYHWAEGYSAYELSYRWIESGSIPDSVDLVLRQSPPLRGMNLIEGFFEYQVGLNTRGHASQTDLMAFVDTQEGPAVLAVEGKVRESFGLSIRTWNKTPGKDDRIWFLCDLLGLFHDDLACLNVKYQLVHRTASAVLEAQRRGIHRAVMLVHSFGPSNSRFRDLHCFSDLLGIAVKAPGQVSDFKTVGGVELGFAWVSDPLRSLRVSSI